MSIIIIIIVPILIAIHPGAIIRPIQVILKAIMVVNIQQTSISNSII